MSFSPNLPSLLDYHGRICFLSNDILSEVLVHLCDQSDDISEDDRSKLPDRVRKIYELKIAKREEDIGVKIALCESLLQVSEIFKFVLIRLRIVMCNERWSFSSPKFWSLFHPPRNASSRMLS